MKKKTILLSILGLFVLSSCKFDIANKARSFIENLSKEKTNEQTQENKEEEVTELFEVVNYKNGVKLAKYKGSYKALIHIPSYYDDKPVLAIGKGCFKRSKTVKRSNVQAEEDCTTYTIPDEVEEIEDGSFESDSTFFVESEEMKEGWDDSAMEGSAEDGEGNIYFNTNADDVAESEENVYTYIKNEDAYCLARCLTHEEEIEIASHVNGKPIVQVGHQCFYLNTHIKKVTFPETLGYLQYDCFKECSNLNTVIFNSPNLSRVMRGAFSYCVSLDVVHMPENMVELSSKVFLSCGTLSEVYLPGNLVKVYDDAFQDTEVLKIVFGGFKERWDILIENCPTLQTIPVECLRTNTLVELDNLKDFAEVEIGTYVCVSGIISGYTRQTYNVGNQTKRAQIAFLTDPETKYTILCFNVNYGTPYDVAYVGREVRVYGIRSIYFGALEIVNYTFEFTEDEAIHEMEPLELDWSDPDLVLEDNIHYLYHYEGVITEVGTATYFEGLNFYIYYFKQIYDGVEFHVGDRISINFVLAPYNQVIEGMADMDSAVIISQAEQ